MRRRLAAVVVLLGVLGGALAACSDDDGSQESFCARLPETPDLADVVRDLDSAEPEQLDDRLSNAADSYGDLRDASPDEIRDDVETRHRDGRGDPRGRARAHRRP